MNITRFMKKLVIVIWCCILAVSGQAQDAKFSQFYNAPLDLNPALTGKINSLYRVVLNYRNQYPKVTSPSVYSTIGLSADVGILRDQLGCDILGLGISIMNDNTGSSYLKSQHISLSVAYHKSFGYKNNHYLSAGFEFSYIHRGLDTRKLQFASQFNGNGFNPFTQIDEPSILGTSIWYPNLSGGIFWSSTFSDFISAYAGGAMFNILRPQETFSNNSDNRRDYRINAHGGVVMDINKFLLLSPNALFMQQGDFQQIIAGTSAGFNLSGNRRPYETILFVGGWYDLNGVIIANTGVQFKGMQIGMSYDLTLADLNEGVGTTGAIEFSLIYVGKPVSGCSKNQIIHCPKW